MVARNANETVVVRMVRSSGVCLWQKKNRIKAAGFELVGSILTL
jgi:hypothetical protein